MKTQVKEKGDLVWIDGYTSFAQQSAQDNVEIEEVDFRFDEATGEKFPVYFVVGNWYDGRNGSCYSNKSSMYYIDLKQN